ncbi:Vanin-like protein 1, partial [Operophtera brumata]
MLSQMCLVVGLTAADKVSFCDSQLADIVVFPELTLTNGTTSFEVPINGRLREYPIPALHPELYDDIYVVLNTRELVDCVANNSNENCPEAKEYVFNTNVVFDRTGAVIDRYRKINLFGEATHTPALTPDLGIFETDFGVTFGHYVCFDLMFQVPAIQVVQKNQLTDIIFTTMWFSEMPYLTGSGIYSGKVGALISIMPGVSTTRLLVTETVPGPIYDPPSDHDGLRLITDPSLAPYYRAVVQDGSNTYSRREIGVAACLIVSCKDRDFKSCLYRFDSKKTKSGIQELEIKMTTYSHQYNRTLGCDNVVYFPVSFTASKFPLAQTNVTYIDARDGELSNEIHQMNEDLNKVNVWTVNAKEVGEKGKELEEHMEVCEKHEKETSRHVERDHVSFKIKTPQNELVAFGIWGRIYTRDVDHRKDVSEEDIQ